MTLVGICFVCGGYFDGGVVVNVGDDECVCFGPHTEWGCPAGKSRFYCYAHASELPAVYVPAEQKPWNQ